MLDYDNLAYCFYCHGADSFCTCPCEPTETLFTYQGIGIVMPNVSKHGEFYVNPAEYYGPAFLRWAIDNEHCYWARPFFEIAMEWFEKELSKIKVGSIK